MRCKLRYYYFSKAHLVGEYPDMVDIEVLELKRQAWIKKGSFTFEPRLIIQAPSHRTRPIINNGKFTRCRHIQRRSPPVATEAVCRHNFTCTRPALLPHECFVCTRDFVLRTLSLLWQRLSVAVQTGSATRVRHWHWILGWTVDQTLLFNL